MLLSISKVKGLKSMQTGSTVVVFVFSILLSLEYVG